MRALRLLPEPVPSTGDDRDRALGEVERRIDTVRRARLEADARIELLRRRARLLT